MFQGQVGGSSIGLDNLLLDKSEPRHKHLGRALRYVLIELAYHPQKTLLETITLLLSKPNPLMAEPIISSDAPASYPSALSKKLTPASYACFNNALASST